MQLRFSPCYVILQAVMPLIFYVNSYATTYYVSTNGQDSNPGTSEDKAFRTIQRAADLVKAGDIVLVMRGTYAGFRIADKYGRADAWIVFKPYPGHEVILDSYTNNYATGWGDDVRISGSSYIEINGFKMTDSNPIYDSDSFANYSQGANREAVKMDMSGNTPPSYIRIINNHMYRLGFHGILSTYWSHHCEFIANYIHNVGLSKRGNGMYIGGYDHIIRGNTIHDAYGHGLHIYTEADGVSSDRILVENNILYNNGRSDNGKGYDGHGGPNGISKGDGIILYWGEKSVVRNNLCYGNYNWGIRVQNKNTEVVNNTVYHNRYQGIYVYDDVTNTLIRNNISYKNQGLDGYTGESYIGSSNPQDHNLFGVDPLFVDPDRGDFHLRAGSPAIDAGIAISGFAIDLGSAARPQGSGWDIGAYEFGGAPSLIALTVSLNANPTSGRAPLAVNFSGNASGGKAPYNYGWDFGDGITSNQQNPTHTYAQVGSYTVKLAVTDNGSKQATASRTIVAEAGSSNEPSIVNFKFTEAARTEALLSITPDHWYDFYIYVDDPQGWNDISYADIWLSHESNNEGTISNRGGRHHVASNYVISYSIADGGIWAKETEGTETWTNISGRLGLYVDDDNNEYEQNNIAKWAKARVKLLPGALTGKWKLNAYVIDRQQQVSTLFQKDIQVLAQAPPLQAHFTARPTVGVAPLIVQFSDSTSGGKAPYAYNWDFGDGKSSNQQNPAHTFQQSGSYTAKLTVTDGQNQQASASRLITVQASLGNVPSVVNVRITEVNQPKDISVITPGNWYDLYLYVDDPQGWNDISYADVWLNHESNNLGTISNRGGNYFAASNYVLSYSIANSTIWAIETEGTTTWTNITSRLGLYVDDDNKEYVQNSNAKWAKARVKLLKNAQDGNWRINAYVMDKEGHLSSLFQKNIRVLPNIPPTATITLSDPSPTKAGSVQVSLTTSKNVAKVPTPLIFVESDKSATTINLSGPIPGNIFTGVFVVNDTIADGIGHFTLPVKALVDTNGIKGNAIKSGANAKIDKTSPTNPQNVKLSIGTP